MSEVESSSHAPLSPEANEELKRLIDEGLELLRKAVSPEFQGQITALYKEADTCFSSAVQIDPHSFPARLYYGEALRILAFGSAGTAEEKRSKYREATKHLFAANRLKPSHPKPVFLIARSYHEVASMWKEPVERRKLFDEALRAYAAAARLAPKEANYLLKWGIAQGDLADRITDAEEIEKLLREAVEKHAAAALLLPLGAKDLYRLGHLLLKLAGRLSGEEALDRFREAEQRLAEGALLLPDFAPFFHQRGRAFVQLSNRSKVPAERLQLLREAEQNYLRAVELDATKAPVIFLLGSVYSQLADLVPDQEAKDLYKRAAQRFEQAALLNPSHPGFFSFWGQALASQARLEAAQLERISLYRRALEKYAAATRLKPEDKVLWIFWARDMRTVARMLEPLDKAELYRERARAALAAAEAKPESPEVLRIAGDIQNEADRWLDSPAERCEHFWQALRLWTAAERIKPVEGIYFDSILRMLALMADASDGSERKALFDRLIALFEESHGNDEAPSVKNLCLWGLALAGRAESADDPGEKRTLLEAALAKYTAAVVLAPQDTHPYFFLGRDGVTLGELESADGSRRARLFAEAASNYGKAAALKPSKNYYTCWSWALSRQAEATRDPGERSRLEQEAAQYAQVAGWMKA